MPLVSRSKPGPLVVDGSGAGPAGPLPSSDKPPKARTTDGAADEVKDAEKTAKSKPTTSRAITPVPEDGSIVIRKRGTAMSGPNIPFVLAAADSKSSQKQGWGQSIVSENDVFGPGRIIHASPALSDAATLHRPPSRARPHTTEGTANASWAPKGFQKSDPMHLTASSRNASSAVSDWRQGSVPALAPQHDKGKDVQRNTTPNNINNNYAGNNKVFAKKPGAWRDPVDAFKRPYGESYCANIHSDKREYYPCDCKLCKERNRSVFLYVQEDKSIQGGFDIASKIRQGMTNEFGLVEDVYVKGLGQSAPNMIVR